MKNTSFYFLAVYLATFVIEAPLRYVLSINDAVVFLYLRDAILLFLIGCTFLQDVVHLRMTYCEAVTIVAVILYSLLALLCVHNVYQILYGIKIFLPLTVGLFYYREFLSYDRRIVVFFFMMFMISCMGLYLDYFFYEDMPWRNLAYTIDDVEISGVREWTAGELIRLAGFARSSYDAAVYVLFSSFFFMVYFRNRLFRFILWLVAGMAIFATTSKGVLASYFLISVIMAIKLVLPAKSLRGVVIALVTLVIALPLYSVWATVSLYNYSAIMGSFVDRLLNTWPAAWNLIVDDGSVILGRGFGGIGTPQYLFYELNRNPADNFFLYLYAVFGMPCFIYFIYVCYKSLYLNLTVKQDLLCYLNLIALFTYGITTNMVENSLLCLLMGASFRYLSDKSPEKRYEENQSRSVFDEDSSCFSRTGDGRDRTGHSPDSKIYEK